MQRDDSRLVAGPCVPQHDACTYHMPRQNRKMAKQCPGAKRWGGHCMGRVGRGGAEISKRAMMSGFHIISNDPDGRDPMPDCGSWTVGLLHILDFNGGAFHVGPQAGASTWWVPTQCCIFE